MASERTNARRRRVTPAAGRSLASWRRTPLPPSVPLPRVPAISLRRLSAALSAGVLSLGARPAHALPGAVVPQLRSALTIGSPAEERLRLGHLAGTDSATGFLLRSAGSLDARAPLSGDRLRWAVLLPELRVVHASALPATTASEGLLWPAVGTGVLARGGVLLARGRVTLRLQPEVAWSANRTFEVFPSPDTARSRFASPFYVGRWSADLPLRPGNQPLLVLDPGQSSLAVTAGAVAFGGGTESQWWGPGLRNALVLGNAGSGFPHLFLRSARPWRTRLGEVESRWLVGWLTESLWFDRTDANDLRALSAFALTFRPAVEPALTVGVARGVMRPVNGVVDGLGRGLDVFHKWDQTGLRVGMPDSVPSTDQLLSLFARWVLPASGVEAYAEWARTELPRSGRELLVVPFHTQGYTLGLQVARPVGDSARGRRLRTQLEATNLEQSQVLVGRPSRDFYTGIAAPHGWTHRGRPLGAAIGPGGQSQWLALDLVAPRWNGGVFAERVRHNNDALYRQFATNFFRHDVSLTGGMRGGVRTERLDVALSLAATQRLNYLFQNGSGNPSRRRTVDVSSWTLALTLAPRG